MSSAANSAPELGAALALPFAQQPGGPVFYDYLKLLVPEGLSGSEAFAGESEAVLLAAWATLLWRYSDQSDFVVGYATEGGLRGIPFHFSAGLPFSEILRQARETISSGAAVSAAGGITAGFLSRQWSANSDPPGNFQLGLRWAAGPQSQSLELFHETASFPRHAVERMGRSYSTLLSAIAGNPTGAVDALSILSPEDFAQVVFDFNQSAAAFPARCVHELFEEQVGRAPQNPALRFHEQVFTYEKLNARANQIAHYLKKRGVGPNVPVALFVERSAEMIIGLLAILKAGGCYVPLVHDDPQARLAYLLSDTAPPVLLTTRKLQPSLPPYTGEVVHLDDSFGTESAANPVSGAKPGDLVCIIYTSGSTGVPKGVAARHSNLANYVQFIRARLGHPQGWHFATVSTISAILGNTSVFGALMSGGCLHVIDYETAMAPNLFADYVSRHPIDVIKIAPSQLSSLLNGAEGRPILPRKYVVIGGEKFTWELLEQIRKNENCKVMNHYGPTETMGCCTYIVDDNDFREWKPATVPLGRPMSNQQLYVLDAHLCPVPVGVAGELCMSGAGLTDGYFHQPQQTAEKFVRNPFSDDPNARLYRTGDLARFLPDGNIEFLGRIDHQVKIRGFRVEPAEVEAVLRRHPDLKQAVVVPENSPGGEKLLAAYLVPARRLEISDIRAFLRLEVPEYMVPSRMVMLESLPLNRNGKVDLPALAALQAEEETPQHEIVAPRNSIEEQLTSIWKEVLQQDRIGVHDNFFELGGHSLLGMQVISRIRSRFGVQFPIIDFLLSPTIAELAVKLAQLPRVEPEDAETERLLAELENMSEEEAERLLPEVKTGDATE